MLNYSDYNIELKTSRTTGEAQALCPKCSHTRKKKSDKCLSVNLEKKTWYCHHCSWAGGLRPEPEKKTYFKPVWSNNTHLSDKALSWFQKRAISQNTLLKMRISEGMEWMPQEGKEVNTIQFNYFEGENLINTKFRDDKKNFKLVKDAEKIPYNLNSITSEDVKKVIIVEGEMDVLSFIEAGMENVISVPNGANTGENNLSYLDRFTDVLATKEEIIIATDNDNAGRSLRNDLAARFGAVNCYWMDFGKYKDANEVLMAEGIAGLQSVKCFQFDINGSKGVESYYDDVIDLYENGLDFGQAVCDGVIDNHFRVVKGYITVVTGIPGHGKSEYVDHITSHLITKSGWTGAYYSPENKPVKLHISKLVRKLSGKGWYGTHKISPFELQNTVNYLIDKIWFIKPPKGFKLDDILESVKELKRRKGISFFVIDAWNKIEHLDDSSSYIGKSLDKLEVFCDEHQVHCFLVAHPTKMQKDKKSGLYEVPNLYNINGSANFFNKADNGLSIYRRFDVEDPKISWTEVHIQKVKFSHWGQVGMVEYDYSPVNLRYRKHGSLELNTPMVSTEPQQVQLPINENFDNEPPY